MSGFAPSKTSPPLCQLFKVLRLFICSSSNLQFRLPVTVSAISISSGFMKVS